MPYIYRITRRSHKGVVKAIPAILSRQERATQALQQRIAEVRNAIAQTKSELATKKFSSLKVNVSSTISVSDLKPAKASYRDLQAQAKALGIPGNQKAGKLKKAIREAKRSGA